MDELKELEGKLESFGKSIDAKIKDFNELSKKEVTDAVKEMKENIKSELKDLVKKNEELQKQLDAMDTKLQRAESPAFKPAVDLKMAIKNQIAEVTKEGSLRDILRSKRRTGEMLLKVDDMTQSNTLTSVLVPDRQAGIIFDPDRREHIRDLLSQGTTSAASVTAVYESSISDSTDVTAEGLEYKQSDFDLAIHTYTVRKLTAYVIVSEELLDDVEGLASYINVRLPSKLKVKEDQQLLYGSGGGVQLSGLTVNATAYSDNLADADITEIDVLVDAARQVRLYEYQATAHVIHPTDATKIKLAKDDNGNYIHPWIFMPSGQITLDGVPVFVTTAITTGQFLTGDFKLGAQVFDRKQATLEMSYENEDNFVKGMVTIRIAERITLATYRAKAFVYGSFAAALAQGSA